MPDDSNSKNMLIIVHGTGEHTEHGVDEVVRRTLSAQLNSPIENEVDIRVIAYNQVFNDWRQRARDDIEGAVGALEGRVHFSRVRDWLKNEVDPTEDNYFMSDWLDVVLYMSTLGVRVQLEVARQLTRILQEFNNGRNLNTRKIVLMGHSLGSAVIHDTLHKMWHGGFEDDRYNNLSRLPFAFTAFYQIANTSRLLKTGVDPTSRNTSVRPAPGGMMERMYNVHHKFDPIALIKQFKIKDLHRWLPEQEWPEEVYIPLELEGIHEVNFHSLAHHLSDPQVYCNLFTEIVDGYRFPSDYDALVERRKQGTVDAALDKFKTEIEARIEAGKLEHIESIQEIAAYWKLIGEAQRKAETGWEELSAALKAYFEQN